jgi:hypothetical protein
MGYPILPDFPYRHDTLDYISLPSCYPEVSIFVCWHVLDFWVSIWWNKHGYRSVSSSWPWWHASMTKVEVYWQIHESFVKAFIRKGTSPLRLSKVNQVLDPWLFIISGRILCRRNKVLDLSPGVSVKAVGSVDESIPSLQEKHKKVRDPPRIVC